MSLPGWFQGLDEAGTWVTWVGLSACKRSPWGWNVELMLMHAKIVWNGEHASDTSTAVQRER